VPNNLVNGNCRQHGADVHVTNGSAPNNCQNTRYLRRGKPGIYSWSAELSVRMNPYFTERGCSSLRRRILVQRASGSLRSSGFPWIGLPSLVYYSRSIDTTAGQMYNTDCGGGAIGDSGWIQPLNFKNWTRFVV